MYLGHFAITPVLKKYYPHVPYYVFAIGVIYVDIWFGLLTCLDVEGLSIDKEAGVLGVIVRCDYTHSIVGSLLLSSTYGKLTGYPIPGFIAAFSHFVTDWMVHNDDLLLDPVSRIVVGGTSLYSKHPTLSHYLENGLCFVCILLTAPEIHLMLPNVLAIILNMMILPLIPKLYWKTLSLEQPYDSISTGITVTALFLIPAGIFILIMNSGGKHISKQA